MDPRISSRDVAEDAVELGMQGPGAVALLSLMLGAGMAVGQTTTKTAPKSPSSPSKTTASQKKPATSQKKSAGSQKKSTASPKSTKKTTKKRVVSRRRVQAQPTLERYQQIQQALVDRGYLQGPATGAWGPESVAALQRFQSDQKLDATGKIDALSLIRLGLGPKRDAAVQNGRLPPVEPKEGP